MSDSWEIENDGSNYSNNGAIAELVKVQTENTSLKRQLVILKEAIFKINREHHDDKTHVRYIESLKKWENKVCKIAFEAKKKIEELSKESK